MNPFQNVIELEIQKMEVKIKTLQTRVKTLREIQSDAGGVRLHRRTESSSSKSGRAAPHHVKRADAERGFRRMAVAFTTRELARELRDILGVVITPGCAYNWLRNFQKEGLVASGPRTGKFGLGTWTKTEKGLTSRWHDRAQPPTV
jgi:hypothetical protein